jgi:hypothetical protein
VILLAALAYATYLPATEAVALPAGMKADSVGAAIMTGIAKGCVPHVAGMPLKAGDGLEVRKSAPDRVLMPSDGKRPSEWGKPSYAHVPTRIGEVWVARFADGKCLVRGWGDALSAMRAAVHDQFEHDGSPWDASGSHYRLTLDEGPHKGQVIEAQANGETVDRPEIQADETIIFTLQPAG